MITLKIHTYCDDCKEFKPEARMDILNEGCINERTLTEVYCKHRNRCEHIADYLKQQNKGSIQLERTDTLEYLKSHCKKQIDAYQKHLQNCSGEASPQVLQSQLEVYQEILEEMES